MTSRLYDIIVTVANTADFTTYTSVVGQTSGAEGVVAAIEDNMLKVKLSNTLIDFSVGETIYSNVYSTSGSSNNDITTTDLPFYSNTIIGSPTTIASSTISALAPSPFIAEKNAFTVNPIVRLYSIYAPGSWYPPNDAGNPTGDGEGYAWPNRFPIQFAEVVGDIADDLNYNVTFNGTTFTPFPVNISSFDQGSDGKINELTLSVFNVNGVITELVEDPYIVGLNTSNSVSGYVNGELVSGLDPATVIGDTNYSQTVVDTYYAGKTNSAFTYSQTQAIGGNWQRKQVDSRDLSGAAVEIITTFANFLEYWPEHSTISSYTSGIVDKETGLSLTTTYAVGDTIAFGGGTSNVTFSADMIFPVYAPNAIPPTGAAEGLIWEAGGSGIGSWLGFIDNGATLKFRAGDGAASYDVSGNDTAVLKITDFPKDGNSHTVTWDINPFTGTIRLWIDDVLKGTATATGGSLDSNSWSGGDAGAYLTATTSSVTVGETTAATNLTDSGGGLRRYSSQLVTATDNPDILTVTSTLPYRVGDTVRSLNGVNDVIITGLEGNHGITVDGSLSGTTSVNDSLLIVNPDADPDSYMKDVFKIDQLEGLSEYVATFGLISWLQYFKTTLPKRRYMKNTCPWKYKGEECQYPSNGTGTIVGTNLTANGYFTAAGVSTSNPLEDVCSKSFESCELRNNSIHFGGFPGTGRTVPRG